LVGGGVDARQGEDDQIVLDNVQETGDGQRQGLQRPAHNAGLAASLTEKFASVTTIKAVMKETLIISMVRTNTEAENYLFWPF
jgi:hypothetical protein